MLFVAGLFVLNTTTYAQNREIAGAVTTSDMYVAGATADVDFTVTVSSPDWEYLEDLPNFPADVTINSASTLDGASPVITGQEIYWDVYFGPSDGGGTWLDAVENFSVNVTISDDAAGDLSLDWTMVGDEFGGLPHSDAGVVICLCCSTP